jgi:hypothetical protein
MSLLPTDVNKHWTVKILKIVNAFFPRGKSLAIKSKWMKILPY